MRSHEGSGKTLEERFWEKVDRGEPGECWEWQGATDTGGYGRIHVDGRDEGTHRVSYELEHDEKPGDDWVLHHCDNKPCVNPNHLYLGDRSENTKDMYDRGQRSGTGEKNPPAKLTNAEVKEIRARVEDGETQYELADEFDVSQSTISHIVTGYNWSGV